MIYFYKLSFFQRSRVSVIIKLWTGLLMTHLTIQTSSRYQEQIDAHQPVNFCECLGLSSFSIILEDFVKRPRVKSKKMTKAKGKSKKSVKSSQFWAVDDVVIVEEHETNRKFSGS